MVSIRGYTGYIPVYRIERASIAEQHGDYEPSGETAVPGHDENVLTMATTAAKGALAHAPDTPTVDAIYTATTSDPFDERGLAAHVAVALGCSKEVRVGDFQGSPRATTNAVLAARDAIEAGESDTVLVVGTDVLRADAGSSAEQTFGAGAGAILLGTGGDVATVRDTASRTTGFVGRFRAAEESPVVSDDRFNRRHGYADTVAPLVKGLEVSGDHVTVAAPAYSPKWPDRALDDLDVDYDRPSTFDDVGYAGAASVLLDLALALEETAPDEEIVLVSYGPGGSDAILLETGSGVDRPQEPTLSEYVESKEFLPYAKHRRYRAWSEG